MTNTQNAEIAPVAVYSDGQQANRGDNLVGADGNMWEFRAVVRETAGRNRQWVVLVHGVDTHDGLVQKSAKAMGLTLVEEESR